MGTEQAEMSELILIFSLSCPIPKLVGFSSPPTQRDKGVLVQAQKRCPELYKKSPCVAKIEKTEETNYRVTCGGSKR